MKRSLLQPSTRSLLEDYLSTAASSLNLGKAIAWTPRITYGMEDIVTVTRAPLVLAAVPQRKVFKPDDLFRALAFFFADGDDRADMVNSQMGYENLLQLKQEWYNKRFLAGLVNFHDHHWGLYIFDRKKGHLL
ncbi:hypothetical protein B0T10DRAFT_564945 [Thelonectria olida]|uniref:Uncharacterized protein n=1 Tax=Thelonectria olida TaxID=1576542 RepID=A0A9P8VZR0_9HYPO|nr:hypothetical protein B0T10DRAFT_564945 [Thelonectria olida]